MLLRMKEEIQQPALNTAPIIDLLFDYATQLHSWLHDHRGHQVNQFTRERLKLVTATITCISNEGKCCCPEKLALLLSGMVKAFAALPTGHEPEAMGRIKNLILECSQCREQ